MNNYNLKKNKSEILFVNLDDYFKDITKMTVLNTNACICIVDLEDENRYWFYAKESFNIQNVKDIISICRFVSFEQQSVVINDLINSENGNILNSLKAYQEIGFFAGYKLCVNNHTIGKFYILDTKNRKHVKPQTQVLEVFGNQIEKTLSLRNIIYKPCMSHFTNTNKSKLQVEMLLKFIEQLRSTLNTVIEWSELFDKDFIYSSQFNKLNKLAIKFLDYTNQVNELIDQNKIDQHSKFIDLEKVLSEVLESLQSSIKNDVQLILNISKYFPNKIIGNLDNFQDFLTHFTTYLLNHINNGCLSIKLKFKLDKKSIGTLSINFKDTGDSKYSKKIQEIYKNLNNEYSSSHTNNTDTTLLKCFNILKTLNGNLSINTKKNKGTNFSFEFKMIDSDIIEFDASYFDKLKDTRALIVDDHKESRSNVKRILEILDIKVKSFSSTNIKIDSIEHQFTNYDLLIINSNMSSWEILLNKTINIPTIFIGKKSHFEEVKLKNNHIFNLLNTYCRLDLIELITKILNQQEPTIVSHIERPIETPPQKINILVADDVQINRMLISEIINKIGFECKVCANGLVSTELFKNYSFDLIILDLQMPIMDGFEAAKKIRAMGKKGRNIGIIALTATHVESAQEKAFSAGIDEYIVKPINKKELQNRILKLIKIKNENHDTVN